MIVDGADWSTSNLTVGRNGSTIENISEDLVLDVGAIKTDFVYDGTTWNVYASISAGGGGVITNDTTTNVVQYIGMSRTTSGSLSDLYVADTELYFNPSTGALTAIDFDSLSDIKLKENILNLENSLRTIEKINPVSFNWKDNGRKAYGVIAQELEKILPELVETNKDTDTKSVSYVQLISFLIAAVKEQQEQINTIRKHLGL